MEDTYNAEIRPLLDMVDKIRSVGITAEEIKF